LEGYKVEFLKLKPSAQTESERATEIAKIEAFDHWIDGKSETKEQMTAKLLRETQVCERRAENGERRAEIGERKI
jgi:hypothetical protein